ncbi:4'-phosphopantetheinyl transferase superfamily protein [Nocardioides dongxiaopingii]|uniref:4'-phosphopantetheinyl transferase superfamily protein n=1 Tax=Nocardioides sp. S-1144 TaxID=2582905 RepID=UPI00110F0243|nr:4'-phosphopantetheinyl transferase superfamily protein [Nocardioides sp. S-1144]QCW51331.1 4'-phosphopantetheinyl transferase superfamily protein [Nocardioides sp. S-1144]
MQQPSSPLARLGTRVGRAGIVLRAAPVDVVTDALGDLPDVEAGLVREAGPARRAQFAVGRRLARAALAASGSDVVALGADHLGAPRWPAGRVGSISHLPDLAVAVVARAADHRGVGVDVAPAAPLPPEEAAVLLGDDEQRAVVAVTGGVGPTVAFAVKEATYKAVHPTLRTPVGYRDVTVSLGADHGFTATVRVPGAVPPTRVTGWWEVAGAHVAAVAVLG